MVRLFRTPSFATVFAVGFFQEVAFALLVNLPGRFQEMGLSEAGIGVAYSVSALTALALRPVLGRILDVVHRRSVLRAAGVLNVAAIALLAVIDTTGAGLWLAFIAQRFLMVALFTTLLTYAADTLPTDLRTYGLAIFGLSGLIPMSISNLFGDRLLAASGYQGLIVAAAIIAAISWVLVWRLPLLPVLGVRPRRGFVAVVVQRDLMPVWWISLMFAMAMETFFVFTRTFITARGVGTLGGFFLAYGGAAVISRLFGGRLSAMAERTATVAAVLGQAGGLALLASAHDLPMLTAGAALAGAAHGVIFPILSSQVVTRARTSERGTAVSIFTALFDVGLLLVAPVVGTIIDALGYGWAYSTIAGVLVLGAGVFVVWDRHLERHPLDEGVTPTPL